MAKKKQRGNGAGTVYPRKNKDGKVIGYRGSYIVNGKRHYVSAKTKTEVEQKLRQAMTDADRGLVFDAGTLTLGTYLDKWLLNIKDTVRQRTWERYEQLVRVHLKPTLGRLKLNNVTPAHVRGLYREKLDAGASNRTVQYIHTTLRKALQDAVTDELVSRNMAGGIKAPRPKKKEINPLSPEQARTFLEATHDDPLEALYVLAIHRGLRQGELLGLKWDDIDLEAGTLQVRRSLSLTRDGHVFEQPKNGKGRSIELTQSATDALRSHLQRQLKEIRGVGGRIPGSGAHISWRERSAHAPLDPNPQASEEARTCCSPPHPVSRPTPYLCHVATRQGRTPQICSGTSGTRHDLHYSRHLFACDTRHGRSDEESHRGRTLVICP